MSSSNFQTLSDLFVFEQMHRVEIIGDTSSEETIIKTNRDRIYSEGSFSEIASYRATGLADYLLSWKQRLSDASLLGLMLLGCYVCRRGALEERAVRVKMARIALPWLLGVGAVGMAIFTWVQPWPNADTQLLTLIGNIAFWPAGAPIFGLGYVAIITLVMENDVFRSVLSPFASVGRMALTNYLLHAFIIAVFTFQWGLGLYGAMGPFWGLMAVFVIFPFMMVASSWWIRHFLFGPAEWLWRTLTYGQLQSFRRVPETGVQSGGLR
jgi:uncharacterized protein